MDNKNFKNGKVTNRMQLFWSTEVISFGIAGIMMSYVTYFATNFMGIPAATAGIIFMLAKIFDGVTDIIAGYVIDRTNSKLGKGRPYDLAIVGYWISVVLLFSAPEMGISASCVYLFVMYSIINSVFVTLLNCSGSVYLSNAIEKTEQSISLASFSGFISFISVTIVSIILPQMVATMGMTRKGWGMIALILAVPSTLIGVIRFFTIKEIKKTDTVTADKFTMKEVLRLLIKNKYILLFAFVIFTSNIGSNIVSGVSTYYYLYIMHDIGLASLMALSMLAFVITLLFVPILSKKIGFMNIMRATSLIGMAGYLLRLLDVSSIPLLFMSSLFGMMGFYMMFSFAGTFVIDCMDYGEWKNGKRSEGIIASAQSVTAKIGTAIGAALVGILMGMAGYEGSLATQSASANTMIILLSSLIPAIFCFIQFILLLFYNLDKKLPQIREDLKSRNLLED